MEKEFSISQFSKHLFWDVDRNALSLDAHKAYIIKQILEYGKLDDWQLLKKYYGLDEISRVAITFRELDPKAVSFISALTNIPITEFRCYTFQQSTPKHWNF
ncbi:MAG: hypothetical protein IPM52_09635 [Bacteroidetes bacterium]|nr:hypothetical protein [Bacteroidota bacterium]